MTMERRVSFSQTLVASAAQTATGTGSSVRLLFPPLPMGAMFTLDLTNAATDAGDTLDVFIQTRADDTNWVDIVHFTQILGNGADALRFYGKVSATEPQAMFEDGTALGAAAVRHLLGNEFRARWAIVDSGDADQTFTFSVTACPM